MQLKTEIAWNLRTSMMKTLRKQEKMRCFSNFNLVQLFYVCDRCICYDPQYWNYASLLQKILQLRHIIYACSPLLRWICVSHVKYLFTDLPKEPMRSLRWWEIVLSSVPWRREFTEDQHKVCAISNLARFCQNDIVLSHSANNSILTSSACINSIYKFKRFPSFVELIKYRLL